MHKMHNWRIVVTVNREVVLEYYFCKECLPDFGGADGLTETVYNAHFTATKRNCAIGPKL